MKPLHIAISLAVLGGGTFFFRHHLPGLKAKIDNAVEKYGGWNEEARKADPVGYIDYALERLEGNLGKFNAAKTDVAQLKTDAKDKLGEYEKLHGDAVAFSEEARTVYQGAESGGGYPVALLSKEYSKDELVNQVQVILAERDTYASTIDKFKEVILALEQTQTNLLTRITTTKTSITELKAQREIVKVEKLTKEADELLAKVDGILGANEEAISILDDPVRSVEELLRAAVSDDGVEIVEDAAKSDTLNFLQG